MIWLSDHQENAIRGQNFIGRSFVTFSFIKIMGFAEWSNSVQISIFYLSICLNIPTMALYIAEIVTIVRHKKFHNSFYAIFVTRAILDLLYVLDSFYGQRLPSIIGAVLYPIYSMFPNWMLAMFFFLGGHTFLANNLVTIFILLNRLTAIIMPMKHEKIWQKFLPFIIIFVYCVPIFSYWPVFKMEGILKLNDPNSTTDRSFALAEAGDAPYCMYITYICAVFSAIFMVLCVLLNICTFVAYKLRMKKVSKNGNNKFDDIEKKLLSYALATFLGHAIVASMFLISILTNMADPKIQAIVFIYYPMVMDTGTVVLSSWFLLWASGTFRQQLIKDFGIIRKTNIQNIRVDAMEGPQNINLQPVGRAVGHQLQNRICSSVQQLPAIS
uniref:Serpentine receptor class gamma n=1 Tax=Globodera rostochiensis TaxID=31243 RepID=A0A914HSP7_GLORO